MEASQDHWTHFKSSRRPKGEPGLLCYSSWPYAGDRILLHKTPLVEKISKKTTELCVFAVCARNFGTLGCFLPVSVWKKSPTFAEL